MSRARAFTFIIIVGAALGTTGCSFEKIAANNMAPVLRRTQTEYMRGTLVRPAREAAPALLSTLDGIIATSPENEELLLLGAELNCTFAFGFLESEDREWALAGYAKARRYAMRVLDELDDELAKALTAAKEPKDLENLLPDGIEEDLVAPLFWVGLAWGSSINLQRSDPKALSDLWRVEQIMKWVLAKDETYFHGGPHLFFAIRYASYARAMGGDPERAKKHFEAVDRITAGRHLMARVLRSQFYAPILQETPPKATIEQILAAQKAAWDEFYPPLVKVLEAKPDLWPEQAVMNAVAKQRARTLLEKPSKANIIPPPDVKNPYVKKHVEEEDE